MGALREFDVLIGRWHGTGEIPLDPPLRVELEATVERLGELLVFRSGGPVGIGGRGAHDGTRHRTAVRIDDLARQVGGGAQCQRGGAGRAQALPGERQMSRGAPG